VNERQSWMATLARASTIEIEQHLAKCSPLPVYTRIRGPELGLIMVRGQTGGRGAPFNIGEMTVCRCTVLTVDGFTGHAYVAGLDIRQAEVAALLDGVLQDPRRGDLKVKVVGALAAQQAEYKARLAVKAAATRVQFFAMATMRA
jgi:alpha-D-ribose 1-methylphosphonate 5-triphosphate synthase subunit PhnG